jgi:branched-chain amino acid transport system permease protein
MKGNGLTMDKLKQVKTISILALIVFLFVLPGITSRPAVMYVMIWIFLYSLVCGTFRFITMTGDWTFAHVGIMAVGAYTSMLLTMKLGWSVWPAMVTSSIIALAVGMVLYSLCLKTRAVTFFWVTWAFGEIIRQIFARFKNPFGGHIGVSGIPGPTISIPGFIEIGFETQMSYYYLGLLLAVVIFLIMYLVERSRVGLTLKSIDVNWELSESLGVNVFGYRLLALAIGSFFVGITGSFYAHWIHFLSPSDFGIGFGILVLLYVVVGGHKTMWGPIIGVTLFIILSRLVLSRLEEYLMPVLGLILMLTLGLFREGLESVPKRIFPWIKATFTRTRKEA